MGEFRHEARGNRVGRIQGHAGRIRHEKTERRQTKKFPLLSTEDKEEDRSRHGGEEESEEEDENQKKVMNQKIGVLGLQMRGVRSAILSEPKWITPTRYMLPMDVW